MSLVKLPDDLKAIVLLLITPLVTEGLKSLGELLHIDLSGKAAAVAAALCGALFFFADALLANVPAQYETIANALLGLLVVILGSFGVHRTMVRFAGNVN